MFRIATGTNGPADAAKTLVALGSRCAPDEG
jgi:hypothetical protein